MQLAISLVDDKVYVYASILFMTLREAPWVLLGCGYRDDYIDEPRLAKKVFALSAAYGAPPPAYVRFAPPVYFAAADAYASLPRARAGCARFQSAKQLLLYFRSSIAARALGESAAAMRAAALSCFCRKH